MGALLKDSKKVLVQLGQVQAATRVARIEKATAAIFEGRGFLERR